MSVNYKDIKTKVDMEPVSFTWQGQNISVKNFLSTDEKYDIVMISLQQSHEEGYYNPILLDMFFHLNLVYMYTDILFSEEDREDPAKLYDELRISGFMDEFLKLVNEDEYQELIDNIEEIKESRTNYEANLSSIVGKFIDDLPANAKAALDIVNNFDKDKFSAVQDFAKAANGGREIPSVVG